jgi:hypothetical protein
VSSGAEEPGLDAEAILAALSDHGVDFVVIGGLAVAAHGYVRATKDVDVVPSPEPENRRRLFEALSSIHAKPLELGDLRPEELLVPFTADGLDGGGNWALSTSRGRIDVMQWVPGIETYDQLRAGALEVDVSGAGRVMFAGYDELVSMKRAAGRPDDRRDLERLRELRRKT